MLLDGSTATPTPGPPRWQSIRLPKQETPETRVRSLGQDDPLEEGMATHSGILARKIPMDRGTWQVIVHGVIKSDMSEAT